MSELRTVLVWGTGLIGTSVGLALRAHGVDVALADRDPAAQRLATDLGAGRAYSAEDSSGSADLVVVAVPPAHAAAVLGQLQRAGAGRSYTDVSSVKSGLQRAVDALGLDAETFVGGHPMAGSERSGPSAARADLFAGRPWVLTPGPRTGEAALARATKLAEACGALPVVSTPERHDVAVALVSHAPHVVASLMAARLCEAADEAVALAGQGLRDVTRVAASDWRLWADILASNPGPVADVLAALRDDLDPFVRALRAVAAGDAGALGPVADVLRRGNEGRARIPGKHGQPAVAYAIVPVVIEDRPGELARLFAAAGEAGVNIEDVAIEHSPGQPVGYVELSVRPDAAARLAAALVAGGWSVHG